MAKVEFHFDFGSPNAYLAHRVVPQIERRTGAKFEYVPVLLGGVFKLTNNRSPAESLQGIKNKPEYEELERRRFVRRHAIERFTRNPFFPVNTLLIMRGAVAAQLDGSFERYVDEVFRHMWAEPKKMDDPEVVRAALDESGLDAARLLARVQEPEVKQRLLENTQASVARGTFGSPTFFVGEKKSFVSYMDDHHGDGRLALWCAAPPGMQRGLVNASPELFFVPPYVGFRGWIGVRLDRDPDWDEIERVIRDAYVAIAPKALMPLAHQSWTRKRQPKIETRRSGGTATQPT